MKKILFLACIIALFSSCGKDGGGDSSLSGRYLLQSVDVTLTSGETIHFKNAKDFKNDYVLFNYGLDFSGNGTGTTQTTLGEEWEKMNYTIRRGVLGISSPLIDISIFAFKIIESSENTLILEPTEEYLEFSNDFNDMMKLEAIETTRAVYKNVRILL